MIYSPEIANPTSAVASAQVSAQVVESCGQVVKWSSQVFNSVMLQSLRSAIFQKLNQSLTQSLHSSI